ncbi:MAG: glycosyltransferase [Patescibacteria group bacterium]|nr:glycosyltransferase [Patescibacteria group bacterium]MBU2508935.1 glycosyltransferase [Patescibacteria group bacterium]
MTILFTGGGTMGPVTPLIAVLRQMKKKRPDLEFAWAGTPNGPEQNVLEKEEIPFFEIPVAKVPRYPSLRWITWPLDFWRAHLSSKRIIAKIKPSLVVSAGGFTGVPIFKAAWLKEIPCAIHQLDAEPGLANKTVAALCQSVTTSFEYDFLPFKDVRSWQVATPCRFANSIPPTKHDAATFFGLDPERPIVLIVGGGTGAKYLNDGVWKCLGDLLRLTQIIHLTGKGKGRSQYPGRRSQDYVAHEFLDENQMLKAYAAADLVVSRAGMGGIADLVCLEKPAILVPIPNSHQVNNVRRVPFAVVMQGNDFSERLKKQIEYFLKDEGAREELKQKVSTAMPVDDGSALAWVWLKLL